MFTPYRKLHALLTPRLRRIFWALLLLMILAAFTEVLGLSFFVVLLGILAEPERVDDVPLLMFLRDWLAFDDVFSFQIAMSVTVAIAIMLGLATKALSTFAIVRFSVMSGYSLSWRLLQGYLTQPYAWSLDKNSADLSKRILTDTEHAMNLVAMPTLRVIANVLLAGSITIFLFFQDALIAFLALGLIGGGYAGIYLKTRHKLREIGATGLEANQMRFRLTREATNGQKEVKLGGLEESYVERYKTPALVRARQVLRMQLLSEAPRFALEALTFIILLGIVLILLIRNEGDMTAAIPTLGIFVFAVMRILPALQQVYYGLASIRTGEAVIDLIHSEFTSVVTDKPPFENSADTTRLPLKTALTFDSIDYSYPSADRAAVKGLTLEIPANATVGVVGGTGAGKTTFIDLALGLLTLDAGRILIDGVPLTEDNRRAWQRNIGYVPQQIYLTNDSVSANIAFGIPPEDRDEEAVRQAARIAALHDFIETELPEKYDTKVGEFGVRLSGGQRQRIGIARALYHNPSVLIMDEATSALDTLTEVAVMDAIQNLRHQKTIVLVAHRLSTVRECDTIFLMEHGRVAASGRYDDLIARNDTFRRMVEAGSTPKAEAAAG